MKRVNITNLDKLRGNKLLQTYRVEVAQPKGVLTGKFTVYNVKDEAEWIYLSAELNTLDNFYIHFRLHKTITDDGLIMVEKRYALKTTPLTAKLVGAEHWEKRIPISNLQTPDGLCSALAWADWEWVGYLDTIQYI
jgi:hypothetical protein